jgi:hypothetical protein
MLCLDENLNVRIHIYQTNRFRFKEKSGRLFVEFIIWMRWIYARPRAQILESRYFTRESSDVL